MIYDFASILIGLAAGIAVGWLVRGVPQKARIRRVAILGIPLIIAMTAWAAWKETFPATFAPFAITCIFFGAFDRPGRSQNS